MLRESITKLKKSRFSLDTLLLRFWGVRGSIPTPGRSTLKHGGNTSCIEIRWKDTIIALDAGTGIRGLGAHLSREFRSRPIDLTLLLTHTHWDHIQGFPFFRPAYEAKNRIRVMGGRGAQRGIGGSLSDQMESPFFPVGLRDLPSAISIKPLPAGSFRIGEVTVSSIRVNHPGFCVGYRLSTPAGSVAYFPDNELARRLTSEQGKVVLSDEKLTRFLDGVDLLVMDTQYDRASYSRHVGWGHGCLDDVVELAGVARVGHLFLFHHDPEHGDAKIESMLRRARRQAAMRGDTLKISAACEGDSVRLKA